MEAIKHITAVQIIGQKETNSVPFLVLCDDGELYIAKTVFKKHPPFEDLINAKPLFQHPNLQSAPKRFFFNKILIYLQPLDLRKP